MLFLFYFVLMKRLYKILPLALFLCLNTKAQKDPAPVVKETIRENRAQEYRNLVNNIIGKTLSLPLNDSTEEYWQDAFYAMEVIRYKQPWVPGKIRMAFDSVDKRTAGFQRALIEFIYTNYPIEFKAEATRLMKEPGSMKVFAMCAEYLLQSSQGSAERKNIELLINNKMTTWKGTSSDLLIINELLASIATREYSNYTETKKILHEVLSKRMLSGNIILYSIQRKNRNYPGIAIIRDAAGNFVTDSTGSLFSVPQLARSITNLPFYLTNGNTPQGIFRMNGFEISKGLAIGPTENIQLQMPFETSPRFFLKDSSLIDTTWVPGLYQKMIPVDFSYLPALSQTYTASEIGRTEVIAHGTTVNTSYYRGQPYYPHTPTQGCLCTKEKWSEVTGSRTESDQQKLVDALKKAGGANGYCIVIEIDDQQKAVTVSDILPYIK